MEEESIFQERNAQKLNRILTESKILEMPEKTNFSNLDFE